MKLFKSLDTFLDTQQQQNCGSCLTITMIINNNLITSVIFHIYFLLIFHVFHRKSEKKKKDFQAQLEENRKGNSKSN